MSVMSVLMMCPSHHGGLFGATGAQLIEVAANARPDQLDIDKISVSGILTNDMAHGQDSLHIFTLSARLNKLILFGKTSASIGQPHMPILTVQSFLVSNEIRPVDVIRLPSLVSSWWHESDNVERTFDAVSELLVRPQSETISFHDTSIAWDDRRWN